MPRFEVLVGNLGTVYHGDDERAAEQAFNEYRDQSRASYGRAAGEPVTLLIDGEPMREVAARNETIQ